MTLRRSVKFKSKKQSKTVSDHHLSPYKVGDIRGNYITQWQKIMPIAEEVTLTDQVYVEDKVNAYSKMY